MKLYLGNLNYQVTEEDLRAFFAPVGELKSVALIKDRETGRLRGFGFVEFESDELGNKAITDLNKQQLLGRELVISVARPMEKRSFREKGEFPKFD